MGRPGDQLTPLPPKQVPLLCAPAANQHGGAASVLSVSLPFTKVTGFRFTQEVLEKLACQSASDFLFKFQKQHVRHHSPHFTGEETEAQGSGNVDKV